MEILYVRNRKRDSDDSELTDSDGSSDSNEVTLLKAKRNEDSEITAELLKKKLISAIEEENRDIFKSLLDEFFDTSEIFMEYGNICFIWEEATYIAMEKDAKHSEEITKLLLDCGIIWSLETKMNNDILLHHLIRDKYYKFEKEKLRLIEMLLKCGIINVNARHWYGRTALHLAEEEKVSSLLVRYGADVNIKDEKGKTPLMDDKFGRRVSVLQTILKEPRTLDLNLDAIDCNGRTALMLAAINNQPEEVELLLNAGASVNLSDHLGFTALHHALYTGFDHYDHFPRTSEDLKKRKEIFTMLFHTKEVEIYSRDKWNKRNNERWRNQWNRRNTYWDVGRLHIIEMLLRRPDIDVNALSFENFSPLDIAEAAITQTPTSIKDVLKEKGAVLNVFRQTETQSSSSFHLDVRCRLALLRHLYHLLNKNDNDFSVDLFQKGVLTLIEAFQDQIVSGRDQQGRNALHLVAICFSTMRDADQISKLFYTAVKELISIGCSVNETDIYGRTPLHYANEILKESLISHGANASIKDKYGNSAIDEIAQQSSNNTFEIVKAVIYRDDETYFLRQINNKQIEIEVRYIEPQVNASPNWCHGVDPKTAPGLLWEKGEYAFRHPLVEKITKEVTDLIKDIAKEIERLDPRFEIEPQFVGSSNEETKIDNPDEFDFCFVLSKISELCEVSESPELPTGFVRLKRKPTKVDEKSDYDSFFTKDGILNTEKLNWQFATILSNTLVNIEGQQGLDCNLEMLNREICENIEKASTIRMTKTPKFSFDDYISIYIVPCIHIDGWWPDEAISNVSDDIKKLGCYLIFDRPQKLYPWVPYSESCARISFSKPESDMIKQSSANAREAYMIGKTMFKESHYRLNYTMKNCLLYCIEALTPSSEKASQLGLSLEEMKSKFHQMDRYLWLKCLMKCRLEFVSQDFCPCYFLPNFSSPFEDGHLKKNSQDWMDNHDSDFPGFSVCKEAYTLFRCTSNDASELRCQLPAPDPLWERFDRDQLIAMLFKIACN